jgi:hypothetical protein
VEGHNAMWRHVRRVAAQHQARPVIVHHAMVQPTMQVAATRDAATTKKTGKLTSSHDGGLLVEMSVDGVDGCDAVGAW